MSYLAKRYILLFFWLVLSTTILKGQLATSYSFEFFNSSHGLASSEVISLAKDSSGFLWAGTATGLSRYDGYEFQNYQVSKDDELIGLVNVMVVDEKNRLWIGSDAGLFCRINNEIIKISKSAATAQGVNDILMEKNGFFWLATENGPAHVLITDSMLSTGSKILLSDFVHKQWQSKNYLVDDRRTTHIEVAPDGSIFFSQPIRLYRMNEMNIDLLYTATDPRDHILDIFPQDKNKVYINTVETEIHKIENGTHTNIQHRFLIQPGVDAHRKGFWYQGTIGLYYFHPETGVVSRFINTTLYGVTWSENMLTDDNFFWVASYEGLIKIKPSIFHVYDAKSIFPAHQDYYSITQLKNGILLFGNNRGHVIEKNDTGFAVAFKNIVSASEIKSIYEDQKGGLWFASGYQGLAYLKNNKKRIFKTPDGLHDNSFSQFLKTDKQLFIVGDQGISEILVDKEDSVRFKKYYYQPNISKHAKFFAGVEASDGSIWIGGEEGILQLKNDTLVRFQIDNKSISVKDMVKDKRGRVWLACDGQGILRCRFNNKNELELEKQYLEKDGLNTLHFLTLLCDKTGNVWAGSSRGITFIGEEGKYKEKILNFDESDGFIKPGSFAMKLYQDRAGVIWSANSFGIAYFEPDELFLSAGAPEMHIISVKQIKTNEEIINENKRHSFSYKENSLNFSFVAIDYANQKEIRYFYKLEGLDSNWISSGSSRSVTYGNLQPGQYTFRVKALNNKGKFSTHDAVYSFTIQIPFWKTWWFLSLLLAVIGLIFFWLLRRRIAVIKTKAAVAQQLSILETRALRSQMNPHFIFNSLNSISQLIASKQNEDGLQYLSKFSRLLRLVLDESEKSYISLKDEMRILDLYLQLETLRFGSSFSYSLQASEELDEEETMLPSFLIHPIIENAIWHGLLHKNGERRLIINFSRKDSERLLCVVKDNGIGIEAASAKKQMQMNGEAKTSKGLKMVKERLALLQQQHHVSTSFAMEDLKDENGLVSGTKCTLEIPVLYE